ncbi:MAG TPA: lipoate--protein ligase family protein [Longimicrobiales bacterium]
MSITSFEFLTDDVDRARTGAWNMALDHALLESVQQHPRAVLRLYRWQPACLSFGRNQPARGHYDERAAAELGIDIVRRPTGGMAVLHDQEITYAVIAPADLFGGPRAAYHTINAALVAGLRKLGVPAELSPGSKRNSFGSVHPCFAEPAAGEVVAGGQKLVGSAQRCEKRVLLQHGSILLGGSQGVVARLASVPFDLQGRATTITELLGSAPPLTLLRDSIAAGFEEATRHQVSPAGLSGHTRKRASELEALYRSADWTWRR